MTDFSVRSDNVDVEQIMRQIRSRIREKRGVDYTEEEIRELAIVKLEKFLDPRGRALGPARAVPPEARGVAAAELRVRGHARSSRRTADSLRFMRRLLRPILKLFFNPNPLIEALHIQSKLNAQQAGASSRSTTR